MSRRRAASVCAALLVAGGLLAACGDPDEEPRHDAGANKGRSIEAGDRYVALGDSYTAAYLTGETDPESGACLRSLTNYPRLVAERLDLELVDASCGGATSRDVLSPQEKEGGTAIPAQIEAVTSTTDLVTISVGANDIDLYGIVIGTCVSLAESDPDGSPCTDLAEGTEDKGERNLAAVGDTLARIVRTVAAKAPKARVVLVGYPQTFPPERPCPDLRIAKGDVDFAYDAAREVTDTLRSAADAMGIEYVDVWSATAGHDICAEEPWIAGAEPDRGDGFAYHPFPEEQRTVADLLAATLG
ncbi:SGNH/GDSL hydrolase family protein [Nocardioides sp. LHD-245]|uniref:SGNH/GDSL hydrolase family protein n=1 Tax=Nocardioides sp. LHD-245 TaxID=3051387 RepID=UPI0027E1C088|nr:SGNH/GDSL hydrolase family protein [Nocardioides sp. LHD-245]